MFELVLGSHNKKKLAELQGLFDPSTVKIASLEHIPGAIEVDETGTTFQENARLKAVQQAVHLNRWVLAEDSGLSVDALDGRPGVYSARYSGVGADDLSNNAKLLEELIGVPPEKRTAFYTCQLCLASPAGEVVTEATGRCFGVIGDRPQGSHGFGYDPLFIIREYHRTFGQLGPATKKAISHRARAMGLFHRQFVQIVLSN
jgi:XTP/dITP diphosphohydrolase